MKYRIRNSHCGDPWEDYMEFDAASDDEAMKVFTTARKDPHNGYDTLEMYRIDVEEKTTFMCIKRNAND